MKIRNQPEQDGQKRNRPLSPQSQKHDNSMFLHPPKGHPLSPEAVLKLQSTIGNSAVQRLLSQQNVIERMTITHPARAAESFDTEKDLGSEAIRFLIIRYATAKESGRLQNICAQIENGSRGRERTDNEDALYQLVNEKLSELPVETHPEADSLEPQEEHPSGWAKGNHTKGESKRGKGITSRREKPFTSKPKKTSAPERGEKEPDTESSDDYEKAYAQIIQLFEKKDTDGLLAFLETIRRESSKRPRDKNEQALYQLADEKLWLLQVDRSKEGEWTPQDIDNYGTRAEFQAATKLVVNEVLKEKIPDAEKILEIGSGLGFLASLIDNPWRAKLIRTDIGKEIVQHWAGLESGKSDDFYKVPVDATQLTDKFGIEQFDAVVGQNVLDVLDAATLGAVLKSTHQVLKRGGYLIHFMDVNALLNVAYDEIIKNGNIPAPIVGEGGAVQAAKAFIITPQIQEELINNLKKNRDLRRYALLFETYLPQLKENPMLHTDIIYKSEIQDFYIALTARLREKELEPVSLDSLFEARISPLFLADGFTFLGTFETMPSSVIVPADTAFKGLLPKREVELNRGDYACYEDVEGVKENETKLSIHVHVMIAKKN